MSKPSAGSTAKRESLYAGKPKSERQKIRYQQLLEAGIKIIGGRGYTAATLRAVCNEAGLTERYFYESFKNREALLIASFQQVCDELQAALAAALLTHQGDLARISEAGLTAVFGYIKSNPERGRLLMIETMGASPKMNAIYDDNIGGFVDLVLSTVKPFLDMEKISEAELKVTVHGMVGAIVYLSQRWLIAGLGQPEQELIGGAQRLFLGAAKEFGVPL